MDALCTTFGVFFLAFLGSHAGAVADERGMCYCCHERCQDDRCKVSFTHIWLGLGGANNLLRVQRRGTPLQVAKLGVHINYSRMHAPGRPVITDMWCGDTPLYIPCQSVVGHTRWLNDSTFFIATLFRIVRAPSLPKVPVLLVLGAKGLASNHMALE